MKKFYLTSNLLVFLVLISSAQKLKPTSGTCPPTTAQVDLSVNNVRARLLVGGDLWWDPANNSIGIYEVPNGSGKNSIYAGSFWIGGIDGGGQIKVASQTYRQYGWNDFWAGPISKDNSGNLSISQSKCNYFDRFWSVYRTDVQNFVAGGAATPDIISWPGNGDVANGELPNLAPFFDANNDGIYNYLAGDYPYFNLGGASGTGNCNNYLFGDQAIWWVFNDIGNIKTGTNSTAFGIEVRAQAFAYSSTNTNINNATFYKYEIINRSNETYSQTFTGVWCDVDLGNASDDYVGCDVGLGLGYAYNGKPTDYVYGSHPPAIGIDFLQGPLVDTLDGIDNNHNNIIDEPNEDFSMSKFMYYVNINGTPYGNPATYDDYYEYLSGKWLDGIGITYGGDGRGSGVGGTSNACDYMFPGTSDPAFTTDWTMATAGMQPDDMRFLLSSGSFTMSPGEVTYLTNATIWAQDTIGGPLGSVALLKQASLDVQALYDNCFTITGLNELNNDQNITCYPNPFNNQINITISKLNNQEFEMKLFDISGKIIFTKYSTEENTITISDKNLSTGTYIVSIKLKNGKSYTKKIVKM